MLYHRGWYRAIDTAISCLNSSLLVRHPTDDDRYFVNLDLHVLELITETRYMQKMGLDVHEAALALCRCEERIKRHTEVLVLVCVSL